MKIRQFEVWLANLNPQRGTESGKKRPVLIVQTDLLNKNLHESTIICPITTNVVEGFKVLRVHLTKGTANLEFDCDVLMEQIRSIDNKRLVKKLGNLPSNLVADIKSNLKAVLDLED